LQHLGCSLPAAGEEDDGPAVEAGEGGAEPGKGGAEPDNYWKKKEALRGSTMSLGDKFSSGTFKDSCV